MKKKRPGTRSGRRDNIGETDPFERVTLPRQPQKRTVRLPSDIADAAEAALDDMLHNTAEIEPEDEDILDEEPKTQTRSPSHEEIFDQAEDEEILTVAARQNKMPLPAPPRTTSVEILPPKGTSSPVGSAAARPSPHPRVVRTTPAPPRPTPPPTRPTPTGPPTPLPRLHSSATVGQTPMTRSDYRTANRGDSLDPPTELPTRAAIDETSPVPDDLILDLQSAPIEVPIDFGSGPVTTDAVGYVPRSVPASLQVVICEDSAHLGSAQSAISASGHTVALACTGRDGVPRALEAIRDGGIDIVVAGLPGGEAVIKAALAVEPCPPIIIASFGGMTLDAVVRAQRVGADLAIMRPHDVDSLAPIMLAASRLHVERRAALVTRAGEPSTDGEDAEPRSLVTFDVFERVLELEIKRARRFEYALSVALFAVEVEPPAPPSFIRGILRARAGNALMHALRDIDIATQLEHDRFFVLMPYTDLKGAAALGRRVIAAVAGGDPVISAGRTFPPRVVGAVAGGAPGQPISFSKLMKDATRALEQARRDGAELAVQP